MKSKKELVECLKNEVIDRMIDESTEDRKGAESEGMPRSEIDRVDTEIDRFIKYIRKYK